MRIYFTIIFLLYFRLEIVKSSLETDTRFLLKPNSLPDDLNFMPSLSNGHLGFTVFGDSIYINGVYNGYKGNSRRARLPNWLNVTAHILNTQTNSYFQHNSIEYTMNLYEGVYEWVEEYKCLNLVLKQRFYAHRYFNRALVYETIVTRKTTSEPITIELHQNPGPNTQAFDVIFENSDANNIKMVKATTKILENEDFQPNRTSLYVAFSDNFQNDKKILKLNSDQKYLYYRFVLTADLKKSVALTEIQNVHSLHANDLLEKHTMKWQEFWNEFEINVEDNMELSQIINAGIFYMANSLPSLKTNQKNNPYFGLSPTGLGRGQLNADYEGHNFWDTEIWMLPAVTQFQPLWSQELFKYRLEHLLGALYNANKTGYTGARFPWESAYTGTEATNPCCPEVATQEIHISADIAVALKQFYATTYNHDWLCDTAWPLVREIAKFLQSRVTWKKKTKKFHIQNVMGPDEDHENVDDNVYTNVVFKQAFEFARFTHLTCDPNANVSSLDWLNIANNIFILYDNVLDYHPQHDGYKPGDQVKQADTILLGYPLQYPMQKLTRLNDLRMYENVTRRSGPAMTWSMFAINYLDVDLPSKAGEYFEKAYREYVRPQFKVWSETKLGFEGSANFLTGIGGFIQAIIHGYGGIRFQLEKNLSKMIIKHTYLMNNTKQLTIKGIKFANSSFELIVKNGDNILTLLKLGNHPLEIAVGSDKASNLYDGFSIQFQTELIIIQTITKLAK
ncbi:protein-glucosylgalactosylhydroxylysine glucosidase [Lucilia cuprina]|uniref:protein-glucosylgalactosylhydroxylysine glucosidase n=1 Tax=Lucilia cuprina TaxID=7375 RepID=UPI001F061730|nr:protein-glucosylgalactosylhydroxylysine glucosidase [Lucilia cuprina]